MKAGEKVEALQTNHSSEWYSTQRKVRDELSDGQELICVCGRLATGFHEMTCRKFAKKVNMETVKRLQHLL
jgi:hypothetical protein